MTPSRAARLAFAFGLVAASPATGRAEPAVTAPEPSDASAPATPALRPAFEFSVDVGGAPMSAASTIAESFARSKETTRFAALVAMAEPADVLAAPTPLTVFAPLDRAFRAAPAEVARLLANPSPSPEDRALARRIVGAHAIAGKFSVADLVAAIRSGGGVAVLRTLSGDEISVSQNGLRLQIGDAQGVKAAVVISDVGQSNGVIHFIDAVLSPRS